MMRTLIVVFLAAMSAAQAKEIDASGYASIQAALDANPGMPVHVPAGVYTISEKIRIRRDNAGLYGEGRIVQQNPDQPVIEVERASGVRLAGLTLMRAPGATDATVNGVLLLDAKDAVLEGLRVVDCRARAAAVELRNCERCTVRECEVRNYKRIAVDDRTENSELYGYAFFCIDGTGILNVDSVGTVIESNRVVETNLFPTREMKEQYKLGTLTEGKKPSQQGKLAAGAFKNNYVSNWHQGSAITVTGPERTAFTRVTNNYIENSAQGIDLHCDDAIVSGNTVNHGMMGIKLTHGARNLIVSNNVLSHIDLWGVLLNPGAISHAAEAASGDKPARAANVDGGTIIANNIVTDYGRGHEYWNWGGQSKECNGSYAFAFYEGQLDTNPPVTDVIVQGNLVV